MDAMYTGVDATAIGQVNKYNVWCFFFDNRSLLCHGLIMLTCAVSINTFEIAEPCPQLEFFGVALLRGIYCRWKFFRAQFVRWCCL